MWPFCDYFQCPTKFSAPCGHRFSGPYLPAQIVLTSCQNTSFISWLMRWADSRKTCYFWTDGLTVKKHGISGLMDWLSKTCYFWTDGLTVKNLYFWTDGLTNNGKPLRLGYWITMKSILKYIHWVLVVCVSVKIIHYLTPMLGLHFNVCKITRSQ